MIEIIGLVIILLALSYIVYAFLSVNKNDCKHFDISSEYEAIKQSKTQEELDKIFTDVRNKLTQHLADKRSKK
jgi:flagellar basal body-associated protein FliL